MEIVSKDERLEYRRWPEDDQAKSLFNSSLKASLPARLAAADFIEARNQPFQAEFSHAETMVADRRGCQLLASNGGGFFEVGRKAGLKCASVHERCHRRYCLATAGGLRYPNPPYR